jgi:hypothetical protein
LRVLEPYAFKNARRVLREVFIFLIPKLNSQYCLPFTPYSLVSCKEFLPLVLPETLGVEAKGRGMRTAKVSCIKKYKKTYPPKPGHFSRTLAKGPNTTTWIWNLHADAQCDLFPEISREIRGWKGEV